jgi:hypothetical protein
MVSPWALVPVSESRICLGEVPGAAVGEGELLVGD